MKINSEFEAIYAGAKNNFWLQILKQCASKIEAIATYRAQLPLLIASKNESVRGESGTQLLQILKSLINLPGAEVLC